MKIFLGIDFGTSGVRLIAINENEEIVASSQKSIEYPKIQGLSSIQDPNIWWKTFLFGLNEIKNIVNLNNIEKISVDGTSGTVLICDLNGKPLTEALMYNDASSLEESKYISKISYNDPLFSSPNNALARALNLINKYKLKSNFKIFHQADWIIGNLLGNFEHSDNNNCLKLGYDSQKKKWHEWIYDMPVKKNVFPKVNIPGQDLGNISLDLVNEFGINSNCRIVAGTTDGVASFLATGASKIGDCVTSIGSTMVIKSISSKPIFNKEFGIYSHRLGNIWLPGGASNVGGQILKSLFKDKIDYFSEKINTEKITGYNYYPLLKPGERFPINDINYKPILTPRPDNNIEFFQAVLEGITYVEKSCYKKLEELGIKYPSSIFTVGGGSHNYKWNILREKILNSTIVIPKYNEAAYGTALLAKGIIF